MELIIIFLKIFSILQSLIYAVIIITVIQTPDKLQITSVNYNDAILISFYITSILTWFI